MRTLPRSLRYVCLAAGLFAVAVAASVAGAVADAHQLSGWSHVAAVFAGLSLGLMIAMIRLAYVTGVRDPSFGRHVSQMVQAKDAGQAVSGKFTAGLRDLAPAGSPLAPRWMRGRVLITPRSITWTRLMTGRARDLTGARCTGERKSELGYTEMTLTLPSYYKGERVGVISLHVNGSDLELAAPAQLLDILRYSLAQTASDTP